MVIKRQGMMFVLSSPSGVGKTTLTKKLAKIIQTSQFQFPTPQENQGPTK